MSAAEESAERQEVLKRALLKIQELRQRLAAAERSRYQPIAVLGMGCRFPGGADDPSLFWELLRAGRDAVSEVPGERWRSDDYFDPDPDRPGKMASRWGGFLAGGIDRFDAGFFGISPREAASLDPQQRLLLEVAWEALEDAGRAPDRLAGSRTGVFVGISANDFAQLTLFSEPSGIDVYAATGNALNAAAGRLSFFLGLHGPSLAVDTACSSSLVAVHLACRSLRDGECRLALAGGVNLMLSPNPTIATSRARMLSPEGRCKTFDAGADGYVRGEGCGLVVLARLSDALADGDRVLAVLLGSAVNQDGASSGLTVPNGKAQQALIREALAQAGVDPAEVGYLEAHGTGTPLGDPIEIDSLKAVLGNSRPAERPCVVGAVKANIGHLEAAAGIAGLIKTVLVLQHEEIPPQIHLTRPNPHLALEGAPFVIPVESRPWPARDGRRIAGVSSFGFSGTNAHVVVGEAPGPEAAAPAALERPLHLYTLSAASDAALRELAGRHAVCLRRPDGPALTDAAFTANHGRAHFVHRLAVPASSAAALAETLAAFAGERQAGGQAPPVCHRRVRASRPKVAFLFSGQGSQYAGMGRALFESQPAFRHALKRCQELLRPELDIPLLELLYPGSRPGAGAPELAAGSPLDQTLYTQPALFALEYALAELWRSWGIEPGAVLGHSVGELAAACTAGVFGLADALTLVARRARLIQGLPGDGAMATVFTAEERVREALAPLGEELSVAALNGPANTVISGRRQALAAATATLEAGGVTVRPLRVSHAFHSPLVEPVLDRLERLAGAVPHRRPHLRWISGLTGETAELGPGAEGGYWRRQLREPVQYARGIATLHAEGYDVFVEIGPGQTLLDLGRRCLPAGAALWLASLRRDGDDWRQLLGSLGELYVHGCEPDWAGFDHGYRRRRVALPCYPFQRDRHWPQGPQAVPRLAATPAPLRQEASHPYLGHRLASPLAPLQFQSELSLGLLPMVGDHRIAGLPWVNLVVYLELAAAAAAQLWGGAPHRAEEVEISQGLILPESGSVTVQVVVMPQGEDGASFQLFSLAATAGAGTTAAAWRLHASAMLRREAGLGPVAAGEGERVELAEIEARCSESLAGADFYRRVARQAVQLGPRCQRLRRLRRRDGEALGELLPREDGVGVETGAGAGAGDRAGTAPRLPMSAIDACFQLLIAALPAEQAGDRLLCGLGSFRCRDCPEEIPLWGHARLGPLPPDPDLPLYGEVRLLTAAGEVVAEATATRLQRVGRAMPAEVLSLAGGPDPAAEVLCAAPEQRLGPLLDFLAGELGAVLCIQPSSLDAAAPLATQLDSLMAVELKQRLESRLGLQVPVAWFFDGKSLGQLAELLAGQLAAAPRSAAEPAAVAPGLTGPPGPPAAPGARASLAMTVAEMEAEAALDGIDPGAAAAPAVSPPRSVLLTGATGFLGAFLLQEILRQTTATVHCLVRAADPGAAEERIRRNLRSYRLEEPPAGRIAGVPGDLSAPLLGLATGEFDRLAEAVDAIYHCGALVKWTYPYQALRGANVLGTRDILRLAARLRRKPVHYVSTVGVFSSPDFEAGEVLETTDLELSGPLHIGYAQSKWVGEKLVTLARERGLPATIHRPNVCGDSRTGAFNRHDHLYQMIRGCVQLGCAPRLDFMIESAPVDYVSGAIVHLSLRPRSLGHTFHFAQPSPLPWSELCDWLRARGYPLRQVPYLQWRSELLGALAGAEGNALRGFSPFFSESMAERARLPHFDCRATLAELTGSGLACPPFTAELFDVYLAELVRSGYLPPAGSPATKARQDTHAAPP
jgi:thioester reductase-like protein